MFSPMCQLPVIQYKALYSQVYMHLLIFRYVQCGVLFHLYALNYLLSN